MMITKYLKKAELQCTRKGFPYGTHLVLWPTPSIYGLGSMKSDASLLETISRH